MEEETQPVGPTTETVPTPYCAALHASWSYLLAQESSRKPRALKNTENDYHGWKRISEEMIMLNLPSTSSHLAVHPVYRSAGSGGGVPLGSGADASRSRPGKDLALNVSSSRSRTTSALKTPSYGGRRSREKINPRDLFTFSYKFSTDIPMSETPGASIDEYLLNRTRIVRAVFPDQRKRRKLNDEEWSVQLLPIQFLFLSASPVIVMRFVSKSGGKEYPPNVPVHATSLLLMEVTDYKLRGLDSNAMPSHLALTVRGILYPQREGRKSLRGHVEMTVGFNLPPALALVPEGIIRGVGETVLRQLAEQMKQDFDTGLAADFKKYSREKLTERRTSP